jgi:YVTN family beta-propeller protein
VGANRTHRFAAAALAGAGLGATAAWAGTLVVANKSEATVSLVDTASRVVRATLPTGVGPHEVVVSPDGRLALVADYGGREGGSTLTVIDLPGRRVARTIVLAPHRRPHGLAVLPGGERALVTAEESRALLVVDLARGVVERTLVTGAETSHMVVASADGARAYVANIGSGSVTVFDLRTYERLSEIRTGRGAEGVALAPDGAELWVTNRDDDTVSVIDTAALRVVATLAASDFPIRAEATPDGRRVLVSCAGSGDVAVFDRAKRALERRVPLPAPPATVEGKLFGGRFGASSLPIGLEIAPDGRRAWVAHAGADVISEIDLGRLAKTGELRAGREPDGMAYSPLTLP